MRRGTRYRARDGPATRRSCHTPQLVASEQAVYHGDLPPPHCKLRLARPAETAPPLIFAAIASLALLGCHDPTLHSQLAVDLDQLATPCSSGGCLFTGGLGEPASRNGDDDQADSIGTAPRGRVVISMRFLARRPRAPGFSLRPEPTGPPATGTSGRRVVVTFCSRRWSRRAKRRRAPRCARCWRLEPRTLGPRCRRRGARVGVEQLKVTTRFIVRRARRSRRTRAYQGCRRSTLAAAVDSLPSRSSRATRDRARSTWAPAYRRATRVAPTRRSRNHPPGDAAQSGRRRFRGWPIGSRRRRAGRLGSRS